VLGIQRESLVSFWPHDVICSRRREEVRGGRGGEGRREEERGGDEETRLWCRA